MSQMATAYFVDGDTGMIQSTDVAWTNKYLNAEEIGCIVPISKKVLSDVGSNYDIWGESKQAIAEAFGKVIDAAVLYGTAIPSGWSATTSLGTAGLIAGCAAATPAHSVALNGFTDMYEAILGETEAGASGLFGLVEDDGYMITGSIANMSMKRKLRNVRTKDGQPIFMNSMQEPGKYTLDGADCIFPINGAISSTYLLISGMWKSLVYSFREDMNFEIGKESVIQDASGKIVYNLFQQGMVALKGTLRLGVALPKPIKAMDEGTGYPFAYMTAT
jgi:HK97 family phage major capsid protein